MNKQLNRFIDDLLIVIVLYEIPLSSSKSWMSITPFLPVSSTIFIYDNSAQPQSIPKSNHRLLYCHAPQNAGVAKAYNEAWKKAIELKKSWLLLFDQDTEVSDQLFERYAEAIIRYPENFFFAPILTDKKGIVSPFHYMKGISKRMTKVENGFMSLSNQRVANSGCLIHTKLFSLVNGFEESLPLDYSDVYFQEKILPYHPQFMVVDYELKHHFSGNEKLDKEISLQRFIIFCESSLIMSKLIGHKNNFYWNSIKRALRLGIDFFSMNFILVHIKTWRKA